MPTDTERHLASAASRLERSPDDPGAWAGAARALEAAGAFDDAAKAWRRVLELAPHAPDAWLGLGRLLARMGVRDEPEACYRRALQVAPGRVDCLVALGLTTLRSGDLDAAGAAFREALTRRPDDPDALAGAAMVLERRGHLDTAWSLVDRIPSTHGLGALAAASVGPRVARTDDALKRVEAALRRGADPIPLHHARGELLDRLGRHRAAFEAFAEGNRLRGLSFDGEAHRAATRALALAFGPGAFAPDSGLASERPVFIVGMPRSGTSLVEQVLSRHPDVEARGELEALRDAAIAVGGYPLPDLDRPNLADLGTTYLAALGTRGTRATDKMPNNVLHLGLAARLVPGARVVYVVRDPVDTGWSCFRQPFGAGLPWATSLEGIAAWYGGVRALMDHWSRVLPLPIHTVEYEALVTDPEPVIRELLAFLDLSWEPECLAPERSDRAVATASHAQVTEPMHGRYVGRSAPYRPWLGPVAALGA